MSKVAATSDSSVADLVHNVRESWFDTASLSSHSWNRLAIDSFILVIVCYSLNTKLPSEIHRSRLIRLLARDGEDVVTRVLFGQF